MTTESHEYNRRGFVARALAGGTALGLAGALGVDGTSGLLGSAPAWAAERCSPAPFRNSLSVSPFTEAVLRKVSLSDGVRTARTPIELQRLFMAHGATEVYQRVSTVKTNNSGDSEMGWGLALERARLARDLGLPFNPELGLWGGYGDASYYQEPPNFRDYPSIRLPALWTSLTLEQMLPPLRHYGALIARQILGTGVKVNYWDLGNEVDSGVAGVTVMPLFPASNYVAPNNVDPAIGQMSTLQLGEMSEAGRVAWCQAHLWPYVGKLLKAVADGIRSVDRRARFSTHISHFANHTPAIQLGFWESVSSVGYLPDLLGTSFYPTEGKSLNGPADTDTWFKDTSAVLTARFRRKMFIAEYGYPSSVMKPPYAFNDAVPGYPQTLAGQKDYTHHIVAWGIGHERLAGIRQWAPDYCTSSWQPMSWFAPHGRRAHSKPALGAVLAATPKGVCR